MAIARYWFRCDCGRRVQHPRYMWAAECWECGGEEFSAEAARARGRAHARDLPATTQIGERRRPVVARRRLDPVVALDLLLSR